MSTPCFPSLSYDPLQRTHLGLQPGRSAESQVPAAERYAGHEPARSILLGESLAARRLRLQLERIAPYFRKALVRGDAGTGKRLVAQALHESRAEGPFVACTAAAVAEVVAERPYGAEVTAMLESVRGGTLYLAEIGDVPYGLQPGLARLIAEQTAGRSSGVRIVAGSSRDLRTMVSVGQFRQDLYAELSVIELSVPSLRERAEDLPVLAEWILGRVSRRTGLAAKVLSDDAQTELAGRAWAGNLRELERVVTHAVALADGAVIEARHLAGFGEAAAVRAEQAPGRSRGERLQDVIHEHVVDVLTRCAGNKLRAAEILGISRSTLYRMLDAGPGAGGVI